jgi:hypothetical protein
MAGGRLVTVVLGSPPTISLPAVVMTVAAPAAGASGGCQTKLSLVKGQPVETSCGPATAKLHFKGKTYSFKPGTCRQVDSGGKNGGTLSLGKNANAKRNLGLVGMSIAFSGNPTGDATVTANQGKVYISDGEATATPKFGSSGTIKGTSNGTSSGVPYRCRRTAEGRQSRDNDRNSPMGH